jgi:hypothetical protein
MKTDTKLEYCSKFLNDVTVVVVFNDDPLYSQVKPMFEQYGFGFVVLEQNLMIIDGEILVGEPNGNDVLKFIEAHEVSHILLGHKTGNEQEEIEADLGAYLLLKDNGFDKSVEILINSFKERHGVEFNENMLEDIENKIYENTNN